jgi:hypothetical protein
MLKAPKKESSFEPVPKGNHVARLYQIIHIGTIPTVWQGETKMVDKVRLTFELCEEKKVFKEGDEPKPYSISRMFTLSMGQKSHLRPFVEGFIGTALSDDEAYAFDIEELLGEACLLNVVHETKEGTTYANIHSATQLPKSMKAPELFNEAKVIDVNSAPLAEIDALPDFLKDKMKSSEEYVARIQGGDSMAKLNRPPRIAKELGAREYPTEDINPDDVPF